MHFPLNQYIKVVVLSMVLSTFFHCKSVYKTTAFDVQRSPKAPQYDTPSTWAVLPNTYTEDFKKYASTQLDTLAVDVFYIYPTLNTDKKDSRWNVPIHDSDQQESVLNTAVLYQASAWATSGKVYVPYYRQAHLRSFTMLDNGGEEALKLAYSDVKRAFEYYLKHYNKGRPIVLVGHSQGTRHAIQLLKEYFDGTTLQQQLVAAYIPGIAIRSNTFTHIQPMTTPSATGGFVSWNTFKRGHYPKDTHWYDGSITTNPITWDLSTRTQRAQHKGFLYSNGTLYTQALDIEITDGLVWSSLPKFPLRFFMSFIKNYHAGDINLFWQDIRENAILRVQTYLATQQKD